MISIHLTYLSWQIHESYLTSIFNICFMVALSIFYFSILL